MVKHAGERSVKDEKQLVLLSFLLLVVMFVGFQQDNLHSTLDSNSYKWLIGYDENYWIEIGECYIQYGLSAHCFWTEPNAAWPLLIASAMKMGIGGLFYLTAVKWLIYVGCAHFLLRALSTIADPIGVFIYGIFLYLNPYIALLHVSMMRDTLVLSTVLAFMAVVVAAINPRYVGKRNGSTVCYTVVIVIVALFLRPAVAIAMVITLSLFQLFSKNAKRRGILYGCGIGLAAAYLLDFYRPALQYALDPSALAVGLVRLLYSPMPWNIVTGAVQSVGADTALVWWWSLIAWLFSVVATIYFLMRLLMVFIGRGVSNFHSSATFWFICLAILILLPYMISSAQVQGPRQSLPATVLLFYVIGVPFIRLMHPPRISRFIASSPHQSGLLDDGKTLIGRQ